MNSLRIDWALAVNLLRNRSGISLSQWAKTLGIHQHTLHNLAKGSVQSPKFETGVLILDVCSDYLSDSDMTRLRN